MTIDSSKYNGICSVCGKAYKVGDKIEWESRGRARHFDCKPKEKVKLQTVIVAAFATLKHEAATLDDVISLINTSFEQCEVVL